MAARTRRRWPWVLLVLLAGVLALAWWLPARWVWQLVRNDYPAVHAGTVGGSVWDGEMDDLVVNGQRMGHLHWKLSRLSVFGRPRGRVDLQGDGVMANGHIARTDDGAIVIREWTFSVPMAYLKILWPAGMRLGGTLEGKVDRLRLADGWPVHIAARVDWHAAQATDHGQVVQLGDFHSRWQSPGGSVIRADLEDTGQGPVALDGKFLVTALGWRLEATARQRGAEPGLRQVLERLGRREADGRVRIQRHGGLTMTEKRL